ncbi:MAG: helix-turn-helix transcriptional regulator [Solirubrobacterales bacterium]|nr:helix-turn-helix transcriptional regulator [Solirubrobacterales bacterium]MCB8971728.1 helix-turn-helix transcriptional regulator [Thermoleophilales bacterium]MCO5327286.1 metalloregulator ArsR/SmtB family transcription factor [Solirubrobacterales bacterium]
MALPSPIPEPMVDLIAARFRLLGEPMRVRAIDALRQLEEASVGELAEELGTSQQNVSRHLGALSAGGVLSRRKEGNRVLYSIADEHFLAMCEHVCASIERENEQLGEVLAGLGG